MQQKSIKVNYHIRQSLQKNPPDESQQIPLKFNHIFHISQKGAPAHTDDDTQTVGFTTTNISVIFQLFKFPFARVITKNKTVFTTL